MPFQKTTVPPSTTSPVTIKFSGLIVLQPGIDSGGGNTCVVGIHKFNRDHLFQVMLLVSRPNPAAVEPGIPTHLPPTLIPLFTGILFAPFLVRLDEDRPGNFQVFELNPFDRTLDRSHSLDARWAINLRGHHLEAETNDGAKPVATVKTGVLYTPILTSEGLNPKLICPSGPTELNFMAPELAASIVPPAGAKVILEWQDLGSPKRIQLPRLGDPANTLYSVHFKNEPSNLNSEPHDELPLYYRILQSGGSPIPDVQRCRLEFEDPARSDEIPCNPIRLDP